MSCRIKGSAAVLGSSRCQDEDYQMHVSIDLAGSVGFRKAPPAKSIGRSCPEIAGSGGIRSDAPMFYLTVWFQRERFEALLAVNIMEHAFSLHGAGGE